MTKTEFLDEICAKMGIDVSALPDRLLTTYLAAIASAAGNGGGGASEEVLAKIADLEARVEALEPGNLLDLSLSDSWYISKDGDDGSLYIDMWDINGEYISLSDCCPDLESGKTYTISFEVGCYYAYMADREASFAVYEGNNYPSLNVSTNRVNHGERLWITFTANDDVSFYVAPFGSDVFDDDGNPMGCEAISTGFYHIMVNEGTEPLPWKPYKG